MPYGINTVSLFAFVFFIMLPIVQETKDPVWAWKVGLVACFLNGVIEILGAFIAESGAPGDAAGGVAFGVVRYRDYFYRDGFHFQNFRPAVGGAGADGVDFRRLLLAPEIAPRLARRHGCHRRRHDPRLVAGYHER